MGKVEMLDGKIRQAVEAMATLRKENQRLKSECETLKTHVAMLTGENAKAQRILAEYQQLRRTQEQVAHRVEKALHKLNGLGVH